MQTRIEAERFLNLCLRGNANDVEQCADAGAAVINAADAEGNTGLHLSSWKGQLANVKFLLTHGARVDAKNTSKMTPLHLACFNGHQEIVAVLLGYGADPLSCSSLGVTPVDMGAACGKSDVLQLLLATVRTKQVDLNSVGSPHLAWKMPFLSSACVRSNLAACRALLHFGVEVNCWDSLTSTAPLMLAATQNNAEIVDLLLQWGADPNETTPSGFNALDFATYSSSPCVPLLSKITASRRREECAEESGIIEAIKLGDILAVQRILSESYIHGHIVNQRSSDEGATPLMYAALLGRLDLVQLLVGYGAEIDAQDEHSGWTALMQSIFHGKFDVAKYLIQVGCDVTLQAANGCTAIDLIYMVETEHDDLEFIHMLSKEHQRQTDAKILTGKKEKRTPTAWSGQTPMDGLKAWWSKMAKRFKNIKWSRSVQLHSAKVGDIKGEENSFGKKPKQSSVHPSEQSWQHTTLSPFPERRIQNPGMRGLVSNSAGFRRKSRQKLCAQTSVSDTIVDSGVGSLQDCLLPVYPPLMSTRESDAEFLNLPPTVRRGSTGSMTGMILRRPSSKSAWKLQSKSMQNLTTANCDVNDEDDIIQQSWRQVHNLKTVLQKFKLDSYLPVLKEHEVDLESLAMLERDDLEEMGVKNEDHEAFLDLIKLVKNGNEDTLVTK